ncbi:hypothetical protein TRFO_36796 [Tritrichomonas foetus]|uniref:Uncharacterized protein n=1 Tax=Tritrichomonas foetus TaxID=1144522 RepID=A0A1J4JFI4_9EUKA|nr:hypothetical protein TRFO_36796 [Tritrichomonas foetus]|eukprot:OHS97047.1 hypothetical protein TRFO_36796 [Tritrichomonas foetus]
MSKTKLISSASYQWATTALCAFLKDANISFDVVNRSLESAELYANDNNFNMYFSKLPIGYAEIGSEDIVQYRLTYESILLKLLNNETAPAIVNCLAPALRSAIIIGGHISYPDIPIIRPSQRSPIKSALTIPRAFYPIMAPYLAFINGVIEKVDHDHLININANVFETMLDILLRRPQQSGSEGLIISQLSQYTKISAQILAYFQQITRIKETPRVRSKFSFLVEGIECLRYHATNDDENKFALNALKEWVKLVNELKGKWTMTLVIPLVNESFIYYIDHSGDRNSINETFSSYSNFVFQNAINSPTVENLNLIIRIMNYVNDSDFIAMAPKIYSVIVKNIQKLTISVYFSLCTLLVDAATYHNGIGGELFTLLTNNWFVQAKDKTTQISPAFKENVVLIMNIFPSVYQMAPEESDEFFVKLINENSSEMFEFLFTSLHLTYVKTPGCLRKPVAALVPMIKDLMNQEEQDISKMELIVPLFSLFWHACPEIHSEITNLTAKMIKSQNVSILGSIATFFSDVMENSQSNQMPVKLVTSFASQFVRNFDDIAEFRILQRNFTFYQIFVKAFLKYKENNPVDQESWQQFLNPSEARLLVYSLHTRNEVRTLAEEIWELLNPESSIKLSAIKNAFNAFDKATLTKVANHPSFAQRYRLIATFFLRMNDSNNSFNQEFKNIVAQFLISMYKAEYFDQPSIQISEQVVCALVKYLSIFSKFDVFRIISLSDPSSWEFFTNELIRQKDLPLSDRLKYTWAITSHCKFVEVVNKCKPLLENLSKLFNEFICSKLPTNEDEQANEVSGAEFCSSFIRAIIGYIKQNPFKDIIFTINKIIARLNPDSITLPDISHIHACLELVQALIDSQSLNNENLIEDVLDWVCYIALKTKGSTLLQLKCHSVITSVVQMNQNNLPVIMRNCFRPNWLTTIHVASGITNAQVPSDYLSVLALGLGSRPSLICKAIAAELANKNGGKFSPLACLNPYFEEELAQHYSSSLNSKGVRMLMLQLPSLFKSSQSDPAIVQHYTILTKRLNIQNVESFDMLFKLTAVADFSDLSPIKPLIPIWDRAFTELPSGVSLEDVLQRILDFVPSLADSKKLTAACIAFYRSFLKASKPTTTFLLNKLRVITESDLVFENLHPSDNEQVITAILSYIMAMETDQQRFVINFVEKIQYILVWAIFLRFNPLYEHYQLPPLLTSVMHAAVPDSSLSLFVLPPSECVSRAIYLPFRHTTEFTFQQMQSCLETLRKFSMLTAELFLDLTANQAVAIAKYSEDFWFLFSNFFQPRHSTSFLNTFVTKAQHKELGFVGSMLPILTGVVKQEANPMNIAGFMTVLSSVVTNSCSIDFLRSINEHLQVFTETVSKSKDAKEISTNFISLLSKQGGETTIPVGILSYLEQADRITSTICSDVLLYLREITKLFAISRSPFTFVSIILYVFDSIRKIETNGKEQMICTTVLGLDAPKSYEELAETVKSKWDAMTITFMLDFLLSFIGRSNIMSSLFKTNCLSFVEKITDNWTKSELLSDKMSTQLLIAMCLIGAESSHVNEIVNKFDSFVNANGYDLPFDLMNRVGKLRHGNGDMQYLRGMPQKGAPLFLNREMIKPVEEVCKYIQDNVLT